MFVHELEDAETLFRIITDEKNIAPYLVEKDYWIMHTLWGLKALGFNFELKGGTSLSKGFKIIDRFSEDVDIQIFSDDISSLPMKKNQTKPSHVEKRKAFFEGLATKITIPGMLVVRDCYYDNKHFMSAGLRLTYNNLFSAVGGVKEGILLEAGFDITASNESIDIDSWVYHRAAAVEPALTNNIAKSIKCYLPEYTFVEKLQTITRKVRQQQARDSFERNFLRHFYDIHRLFQQERVKKFIGSEAYEQHKCLKFKGQDNPFLKSNLAFNFDSDLALFERYRKESLRNKNLYIAEAPTFDEMYRSIIQIREIG